VGKGERSKGGKHEKEGMEEGGDQKRRKRVREVKDEGGGGSSTFREVKQKKGVGD
jgi:hypothetical protein